MQIKAGLASAISYAFSFVRGLYLVQNLELVNYSALADVTSPPSDFPSLSNFIFTHEVDGTVL